MSTPAAAPVTAPAPAVEAASPSAPLSSSPAAGAPAPEKPATPPTPTEVKQEIRRLKLKMDGVEHDLPEEEVLRLAQLGGSANKRFQEAAAVKKQTEQVLEFLKANPKEALKRLGIDVRKFSEDALTEIIQREAESPENKQIREQAEKIAEYERRENEQKTVAEQRKQEVEKQAQAQAAEKKQQAIIEKFDKMFTEALTKASVPKTVQSVARMAQLQQINNRKGLNLDADTLAKVVSKEYADEMQAHVASFKTPEGKIDGAKLLEYLGKDVIGAITEAKIAKLKSARPTFSKPVETPSQPETPSRGAWREFQKKSRHAV